MNFKKWWKNIPFWFKIGTAGFLFSIFLLIIMFSQRDKSPLLIYTLMLPTISAIKIIFPNIDCNDLGCGVIQFIFHILIYTILGAIIVLIIYYFLKKSNKN